MPRNSRYALQAGRNIMPVDNLQGIMVLAVELTAAQVFEPEAFHKDDICLPKNGTLRVLASDGACWATVAGFTPLGNVILVPDGEPLVEAKPAASKRRAA